MTQTETLATLRTDAQTFNRLLGESSLDGETEHDDLYLNVLPDRVEVLQAAPGEVVLTYCTFDAGHFEELSVDVDVTEREVTDKQGNAFEFDAGVEAIVNVEDATTYLDFAVDGNDTVEIEFTGQSDGRLASHIRVTGPVLNTWTRLPGSEAVLEDVPHWLAGRFNDDEQYTNPQGDPAPTRVETKVGHLERVVEVVDTDSDSDFYPVTVDDGNLILDVGDHRGSGASGTLPTLNVTGPDVENSYYDGFEEVLSVVSGRIELQTAPGNNPVAVVADHSDHTIRHVVGAVSGGA